MGQPNQSTPSKPNRKTADLRKGRASIEGARYFVTLTTADRSFGLTEDTISNSIKSQLREHQDQHDINLHCGTIMPDHIHLLFSLGSRLSLSQVIQKFKSKTKQALNSHDLKWQANIFEHRLRSDVEMEKFSLYIYLNPYRKKLLALNEEWPDWILNRNYRPLFGDSLRENKYPRPEWLQGELGWEDLDPSR